MFLAHCDTLKKKKYEHTWHWLRLIFVLWKSETSVLSLNVGVESINSL